MKTTKVLALVAATSAMSASVFGQLEFKPQTTTGIVPDGGVLALNGNVSGLDPSKTWYVYSVTLEMSGETTGSNGEIFAKLGYGDIASAVLLNRPGTGTSYPATQTDGYNNNGFKFEFVNDLFAAAGTIDAHAYQTSASYSFDANNKAYGTYLVDGRLSISSGTTDTRDRLLSNFNGLAFNSSTSWQLYLQDNVSGINRLKVDSWSITFTNVPEPSQYAMMAGLGLIGFAAYRRYRVQSA